MSRILIGAILCNLLFVTGLSTSQAAATVSELEEKAASHAEKSGVTIQPVQDELKDFKEYRMEEESNRRLLAVSIMIAAITALTCVLFVLHKHSATPDAIVGGSGLVLVIFATILVSILAKTDEQLTAPIGILGAIAGYLFGKTTKGTETAEK